MTTSYSFLGLGSRQAGAQFLWPEKEFLRSENASLFHVFPVLLRDQVLGILLAAGSAGRPDVDQAAIQLLTLAAEAWVEAVGSRRREPLGRRAAAASA